MALSKRLLIRLSPEERAAIEGAARFRGVTLSRLVRDALRQEVEHARQEWRENRWTAEREP